jgi:hypothetical protein
MGDGTENLLRISGLRDFEAKYMKFWLIISMGLVESRPGGAISSSFEL